MEYTAETIERKIIGPYTGKHIAGTSNDVYDALVTIEYRFDGFVIRLSDIPARWDAERKRQYISGSVGFKITETLEDVSYTIQRHQLDAQINKLLAHRAMLEEQLEELREEMRGLVDEPSESLADRVRKAVVTAPIRASIKVPESLSPAA